MPLDFAIICNSVKLIDEFARLYFGRADLADLRVINLRVLGNFNDLLARLFLPIAARGFTAGFFFFATPPLKFIFIYKLRKKSKHLLIFYNLANFTGSADAFSSSVFGIYSSSINENL